VLIWPQTPPSPFSPLPHKNGLGDKIFSPQKKKSRSRRRRKKEMVERISERIPIKRKKERKRWIERERDGEERI